MPKYTVFRDSLLSDFEECAYSIEPQKYDISNKNCPVTQLEE